MGKPKPASTPKTTGKAPPCGRVLRGDELVEGCSRSSADGPRGPRLAYGEAMCAVILAQPASDPRRPLVPRMWALLAAARRRLDRGHYSADWMVEIEALGSRMNWLYLERQAAHGAKFPGGRPKGILWRAIEEVVRDSENHLRWTDVMHAMLPSSRKPGSPRAKRGDRMSGRSSSGQT